MDVLKIVDIIRRFGREISVIDIVVCVTGLILFCSWLVKTSWGRRALVDSVPRRNNMPFYLPFVPLFIWLGGVSLAGSIAKKLLPDLPDWQSAFLNNASLCMGSIAAMAVIIFLARTSFARRLKGFGLNVKTIHKDFGVGFVNLLSVWPFVILMIILTMFFGKLIWGQGFEMQQHQELELIAAHSQLPVRVLIVVTVVVVMPVFEEMLFRGLFQTMIRSFLGRFCAARSKPETYKGVWLSIVIASGLFATIHSNAGHWPALFALSMCMGYAYEKSGSLFRPIFIHSLFNTTSIIFVLLGT